MSPQWFSLSLFQSCAVLSTHVIYPRNSILKCCCLSNNEGRLDLCHLCIFRRFAKAQERPAFPARVQENKTPPTSYCEEIVRAYELKTPCRGCQLKGTGAAVLFNTICKPHRSTDERRTSVITCTMHEYYLLAQLRNGTLKIYRDVYGSTAVKFCYMWQGHLPAMDVQRFRALKARAKRIGPFCGATRAGSNF